MASRQRDGLGLVLKAVEFAAHKHRDQRRKNVVKTPYINHPIALAQVLRELSVEMPPYDWARCGMVIHPSERLH